MRPASAFLGLGNVRLGDDTETERDSVPCLTERKRRELTVSRLLAVDGTWERAAGRQSHRASRAEVGCRTGY